MFKFGISHQIVALTFMLCGTAIAQSESNFLIDRCIVSKRTEISTRCEERLSTGWYLANFYGQNSLTIKVIVGEGMKSTIPDQEFTLPVKYKKVSKDTIETTVFGKNSCNTVVAFTYTDGKLYERNISQNGTCDETQRLSFQDAKARGREQKFFAK